GSSPRWSRCGACTGRERRRRRHSCDCTRAPSRIQEWPPRSGAAHMMAGALAGRVLNGLSDSVAADLERAKWLSEQTIRLSPHDPELGVWYKQIGAAHLLQSHTAEAVIWLEKARNHTPAHPMIRGDLASACALAGQTERASAELAEARRLSPDDRY